MFFLGGWCSCEGPKMENSADVQSLFFQYDVQKQPDCHKSLCSRHLIRCQVECEYEDTSMILQHIYIIYIHSMTFPTWHDVIDIHWPYCRRRLRRSRQLALVSSTLKAVCSNTFKGWQCKRTHLNKSKDMNLADQITCKNARTLRAPHVNAAQEVGYTWGQNEFENMPATFEATDEDRAKCPNPEDLQQELLGRYEMVWRTKEALRAALIILYTYYIWYIYIYYIKYINYI